MHYNRLYQALAACKSMENIVRATNEVLDSYIFVPLCLDVVTLSTVKADDTLLRANLKACLASNFGAAREAALVRISNRNN